MLLKLNWSCSLAALLVGCTFVRAADTPPQLRLPDNVVPVSYRAALTLDPPQTSFAGDIRIKINIKVATQTIWLNASAIDVISAKLIRGGTNITAEAQKSGHDFLGFHFAKPLQPGAAELGIAYRAQVQMHGSAGVFSMQQDGNQFLFTQFESTDARDAFPCFDEPSYKVPWQLTLTIPANDDAVSNTDPGSTEPHGTQKTLRFNETKPLPSYLVAFAVGKFDFVPAGFAAMPARCHDTHWRAVLTRKSRRDKIELTHRKRHQITG